MKKTMSKWFLEYASCVCMDRAIPDKDGLKPVQRRILYSLWSDTGKDSRYHKVANMVGQTMKYHPHGDMAIYEAMITLGEKNLLLDKQGNWGNTVTGDPSAAGRYIEVRLSKLARKILYSDITEYKLSYDSRNKEPVVLPVKFPLLLVMGVEGIAVGISTKILPHNFNEIIDCCIKYIKNNEFQLLPDFQMGGLIDVSNYQDGFGKIKVRAKIDTHGKSVVISEIPFGTTVPSVIESIVNAQEKGQIKYKGIVDETTSTPKITIDLYDNNTEQFINALYAFTDCSISLNSNPYVIDGETPKQLSVSQILRNSVESTKSILQKELELELKKMKSIYTKLVLEKIFIENQLYKLILDSNCQETIEDTIFNTIKLYQAELIYDTITIDDIKNLIDMPIKKIGKIGLDSIVSKIEQLKKEISIVESKILNINQYTIDWFMELKDEFGKLYPRKSKIVSFDTIDKNSLIEANNKLFYNCKTGFIGTKKIEDAIEHKDKVSIASDIIVVHNNGNMSMVKPCEKKFVGENIFSVFVKPKNIEGFTTIFFRRNGSIYGKTIELSRIAYDKPYPIIDGEILFSEYSPSHKEMAVVFEKRGKKLKKDISTSSLLSKKGGKGEKVLEKTESFLMVC